MGEDSVLKIGLIADIHYGANRGSRMGTEAGRLLEGFLEAMDRFRPALIVDLGDRVMDIDPVIDWRHTLHVQSVLSRARVPVYHVFGNHDVKNNPKREICDLLGVPAARAVVRTPQCHLVILDTVDPVVGRYGGHVSDEQLEWLRGALAEDRRPVVVFTHHPLDDQDTQPNPLFSEHPEWALVDNRRAVRDLLFAADRVVAVISCHVHWNYVTFTQGVPFVTIQSLIETWCTHGRPAGAYGKLWIGPGRQIRLVVEGRDPLTVHIAPAAVAETTVGFDSCRDARSL